MTARSTTDPNAPDAGTEPQPGSPDFRRDFNSFLRNILLANPLYARICADQWQAARPNSLVSKLLQLNYQKNLSRNPMSNIRTCTDIKVTGVRCGSPALRGERYCYFHYRMLCTSRVSHVALLENEEAIQVSLMEIVNSLLCGTIDIKRGELVLRALNTAVRNIRRARFEKAVGMVRELPEPVVQPRPKQYSKEEIDQMKKQMLAEYYERKNEQQPASVTKNVAKSVPSTAHVGTAVPGCPGGPAVPVRSDRAQRKPPAGVKKVPAAARLQSAAAPKSQSAALAKSQPAAVAKSQPAAP
jgi:hypothetical protein